MKTGSAHQHPPTHTKHTRPPSLLSATASCPPLSCPYRRFDEPLCNCLCNEAATAAGSIHCNKRQLQQCCPSAPYLPPPSPCLPHPLYVRSAHLLHRFRKLCKEPPKKAKRSALLLPSCRVCARNKVSNDTSPRTTHCHAPFATTTTLLPGPGQV